jgi:hypothetical protein
MKKTTLLFLLSITTAVFAGKGGDEFSKFEKIFFKSSVIELGDITITLQDAVANDEMVKFKMNVKNNTTAYLMVKPSDIAIVLDGKENKAYERTMIIGPNDDATKVVDFKGAAFRQQQLVVRFNGFNKVVPLGKAVDAPNFKLPVEKNEIAAGPFRVFQVENEKKTDIVAVKFGVTYSGSNIGIVAPSAASLKFPNGSEFANMKNRIKPMLLEKGQTDNFKAVWRDIPVKNNGDAQFANLEILWKETFLEGKSEPIPTKDFTLEWDLGITKAKK